ncbi:MAG: biopolymer transporter ExbD [Rickettsiales bacterium]|jgi:biopolymer transport protein TolR|nr:biopolymer transporter ExbD [Rickettsiales bacterium]
MQRRPSKIFKESKRVKREKSYLNLTPMIDIMTVLLCVFMVTAPMLTSGLNLELPKGGHSTLNQNESVVISIDKNGNTYLGQEKLTFKQLVTKLNAMHKENKDVQLVLSADTSTNYGKVIEIMGALKDLGWQKIGLKTKDSTK